MRFTIKIHHCAMAVAVLLTAIVSGAQAQSAPDWGTQFPLGQISKDLSFLQSMTSDLSQAASQSNDLDYRAIAEIASSIKKRAVRLRACLALSDLKQSAECTKGLFPADTTQLRAALMALSEMISDAVSNTVLNGYLLGVPRSAIALRDLNEIVELSERVKVSSELLSQSSMRAFQIADSRRERHESNSQL